MWTRKERSFGRRGTAVSRYQSSSDHPRVFMGFHYEDIFLIIGDLGPFQLALVLLVHLPCLSVAINTYAPLFTLFTPNHRCRLPKSIADHDSFANDPGFNRSRVISAWIPRSSDGKFKECCLQNGSDLRPTEHSLCTDFVYDESVLSSSAASEWNFVCESRSLITASQCRRRAGAAWPTYL